MDPHLFSVILAGGSGTRFWPASRKLLPKQLLAIGPEPECLLAATVRRIEPLCPAERTLIATGVHLLEATRALLPWLSEASFLGEPVARNTAPCIAWATWEILARDPEAVVMVLPSDQHIGEPDAYRRALSAAVETARTGAITTIGLTPSRPETGYGYVEAGEARGGGALRVARFVEKPDRARAEQYLASGRHYWNSGMFFFRADVMAGAIRRYLPELGRALDELAAVPESERGATTAQAFGSFPSVSIDYAVMEKAEDLAVVPASFGWSDLGSWQSAWELADKDELANAAPADAVLADARGNLVRDLRTEGGRRVIALVGVEGLCVIETDDALLVIPREQAQDVRKVVDALKARGRTDLL
ncbi:MAG: mannose-6-phosphate isomerase [Polyangiaceae bacterium]|nr:mannose-6-phosphate isomerase [Polyangiaceae bacterium]MCE7893100.1 mannose-6-phosphate isomerase [Sorangiineae bacterium PRO1]MCL4751508.1 mannose-6-phosphate isomerase [Myxococcales bacterium]